MVLASFPSVAYEFPEVGAALSSCSGFFGLWHIKRVTYISHFARRRSSWLQRFRNRLRRPVPSSSRIAPALGYPVVRSEPDFAAWAQSQEFDETALRERIAGLKLRPRISIVLPVHDPELPHLQRALQSVEAQVYPNWELSIVDDASENPAVVDFLDKYASARSDVRLTHLCVSQHIAGATNVAINQTNGEFLVFLDHDDELTANALLEVVELINVDPAVDVIYSDHDILDAEGALRTPCFKPDWCPELLLSYMYFGHLKVYRAALVKQLGGLRHGFEGAADYDLALRMVEATSAVKHIPRILYHWRAAPRSLASSADTKPRSLESGRIAVEEALRRRRISGNAALPLFAEQSKIGVYKIEFRNTLEVPVTILIPTKDKLALLSECIASIEQKTAHQGYRITIIDNDSREPETLDYLARTPHRVLRFESRGVFNFAAMMNAGVAQTETEYFVLLNNDTLVVSPEWLDELLGYGRMPGVGAVGAKLLYANGTLQHAGVVLGTHGLTGHAFQARQDTPEPSEYLHYAHVARNYMAVTAACMLSHKTAFDAVGGLNQTDLKVAWNDVDYCLRLYQLGYRSVFNPHAVLYHLESQSRGDDKNPAEIRYMLANWRKFIDNDPHYSPNLSRRDANFRIKTEMDEEPFFFYREYR